MCFDAPLDEGLARAAVKRLKCTLVQGYGLTETSPLTHFGRDRGKFAGKLGSVGVCAPNTEAKVIDCGTGLDLGVGQRGELLVRGPQVMQGYLARPAETAAAIDGDGWLHTGDVAYFDAEEVMSFVASRVAPHKRIRRVECVADIPKSPSGKILRRVLAAREKDRWQGAGGLSAVDDTG